ncbi:leucyl aminopeptidase [Methyloligella solikamskensis]|uniref:Probable cytosol aminopeptidase n=1 Tax=Methyloligella solikamskensis TaxID=1177756 RepID=A0ABW3JBN8_9HYPH
MTDQTTISFASLTAKSDGVVVVFAEEGPKLTESAKAFDKESKGLLAKAMKVTDFKGKKDSSVDLLAPANLNCSRIVLAGLGNPEEVANEDWLNLGGKVRAAVTGKEAPEAHVFLEAVKAELSPEDVASFALGTVLRSYGFKKYKSKKNAGDDGKATPEKTLKKIVIHCADPRAAQRAFTKEKAVGRGVNFARDLVNEPANVLTPQEFAKRARTLAKLGVEVEVLTEQRLKRMGMNALLAVGQGSTQPSHVVVMQWKGAGEKSGAPIAFVGKGVVFDAGGISLKPASGMEDMKGDMAGAACVVGLMHELAERKAKVNAVGVIGVVENMPDGNAMRPGDVVQAMSGTTIEVLNTDAEGRMVLADCLWYTQDRFKPKAMINLATLTGAVMVALGKEHAGLFSNNDELSDELIKAGEESGEKLWRLPLGPKYDKLIDSKVADIKNTGGRWGGSISAAQFLQRFVKSETPWAHLDIAGMGMGSPETDVNRSWGSGFGVRLLDRLVRDQYEK